MDIAALKFSLQMAGGVMGMIFVGFLFYITVVSKKS